MKIKHCLWGTIKRATERHGDTNGDNLTQRVCVNLY